jgi:hypothetical protein
MIISEEILKLNGKKFNILTKWFASFLSFREEYI